MPEIRCPKCGEVFQVDETGYAKITQQVRDKEFEKELERCKKELAARQEQELEVLRLQTEKKHAESITQKDAEISARDKRISELQSKLDVSEKDKKLAVAEAIVKKDAELAKERKEYSENLAQKNSEISDLGQELTKLQTQLDGSATEMKLAVKEAVEKKNEELSQKATEIVELEGMLKNQETESRLNEKALKEQFEREIKRMTEQLEYYRDFKARQSTKMIGESLEQHCLTQFNSIRMTAFPNAYFEKDNDARTGSKGDFIYREYGEDGTEYISIMFEMKNEADETSTKHKNEDFLKELDKDRNEKNCEYAILVSLLEIDNELYNNGIVDVSYKYPKMYVIRPQFFIPMITLLRNAALNALHYKQELQVVQNQQIDISRFEENMEAFKKRFSYNFRLASEKFRTAIEEIDKTIDHLQKVKNNLISSENNLRLANEKAEDLTIKKLTKNAPAVKAMFDELK